MFPPVMPSFRVENVFECSQQTFWEKVFFDAEYNRRMFYDEFHFSEWRELEQKDEGARVRRWVKATPPLADLPGPLKAAIGDGAGYEERGVFERATNRYDARVRPNRLGDKVTVELAFRTEPIDERRCRRIVDGTVVARVFVIGGLLEQRMLEDLRRSYEKSAAFTNRFVAEKGWH
jgi:Protein of unknown function (DUF2505)